MSFGRNLTRRQREHCIAVANARARYVCGNVQASWLMLLEAALAGALLSSREWNAHTRALSLVRS